MCGGSFDSATGASHGAALTFQITVFGDERLSANSHLGQLGSARVSSGKGDTVALADILFTLVSYTRTGVSTPKVVTFFAFTLGIYILYLYFAHVLQVARTEAYIPPRQLAYILIYK